MQRNNTNTILTSRNISDVMLYNLNTKYARIIAHYTLRGYIAKVANFIGRYFKRLDKVCGFWGKEAETDVFVLTLRCLVAPNRTYFPSSGHILESPWTTYTNIYLAGWFFSSSKIMQRSKQSTRNPHSAHCRPTSSQHRLQWPLAFRFLYIGPFCVCL